MADEPTNWDDKTVYDGEAAGEAVGPKKDSGKNVGNIPDGDRKPTCFIIMPITTHHPELYGGDRDHFFHVLEHLFEPAIREAGLEPIRPIAKGADIIHAEIIGNLNEGDMVLCDMSGFNPNVFFELGVRTALNKPICLVKDDKTPKIPFDIAPVNTHTYSSGVAVWEATKQVRGLAQHIRESVESGKKGNFIWKFYGLENAAGHAFKDGGGEENTLELVKLRLEGLAEQLANHPVAEQAGRSRSGQLRQLFRKTLEMKKRFPDEMMTYPLPTMQIEGDTLVLERTRESLGDEFYVALLELANASGFRLILK
mgnify:CR=1 FL=1